MCIRDSVDRVAGMIPVASTVPEVPSNHVDEIYVQNNKLKIPDAPSAGISSLLQINNSVSGRQVLVKVDITHSYRGDLLVELINPDGKVTVLHNRLGASMDNIKGTYGEDLSSAESLSALSTSKAGVWSLRITDKMRVDTGVLNSWSLILR